MGTGSAGHRPLRTSRAGRLRVGGGWGGGPRASAGPEHSWGEGPASTQAVGPPGAGGAGGSPLSHREPLHPGGQRQAPVTGWQVAPRRQAQRPSQWSPKVPSGQAAGRDGGKAMSLQGLGGGQRTPAYSRQLLAETLLQGTLGGSDSTPPPTCQPTTVLRLPHPGEGCSPPPSGSVGPLGLPAPVPSSSHSRL